MIDRLRRTAAFRGLSLAAVLLVVTTGSGSDAAHGRRPRVTLPPREVRAVVMVTSPFIQLNVPGHAEHLLGPKIKTRGPQSSAGSEDVTVTTATTSITTATTSVATTPDAWSPVTTLRTPSGGYASPVHATLMPDGRVAIVGIAKPTPGTMIDAGTTTRAAFVLTPPPVGTGTPAETTIAPIDQPLDAKNWRSGVWVVNDDLVCMGQALTADGVLFTAGGTRSIVNTSTGQTYVQGLTYATTFDGRTWSRVNEDMRATATINEPARWYPTVTRLPDGRMLVTSGFDVVAPTPTVNVSAEIYDPATGTWTVASAFRQTPFDIVNSDYTHQFVLPSRLSSFDVLMFGEPGIPVLMSTAAGAPTWSIRSTQPRPGSAQFQADRKANGGAWVSETAPNNGATSAMLPIRLQNGEWGYGNGTVLIAGGALGSTHAQSVDAYDATTNQWRATIDTSVQRHDASSVVLPDGRVLLINGRSGDPNVRRAAYVDPTSGFAYSLGSSDSGEVRGYHSVALLLPDGRVLVGGGRDINTDTTAEKPSLRYYYPHYMFAARPAIVSAPTTLSYGATTSVTVSGPAPAEAMLVSLGSSTHEFDSGQRSVQLALSGVTTAGSGYSASITGPISSQVAPPGHYMLFILDSRRIPSTAKIVQVR